MHQKTVMFITAMKNKLLILFVALLANQIVIAQNRPKSVELFKNKLLKKGIDTMIIYVNGCANCMVEVDRPDCHCLDSEVVNEVYFIYKKQGRIFKTDYSCCTEDSIKIKTSKSIPYFISLNKVFSDKSIFLNGTANTGKFPAPVTDEAYEDIELIAGEKYQRFTLYFNQRHEGHEAWKKFPWIDNEIKLADLIRNDLGLP